MEKITLKNGLRFVLESVPGVRSASAGIWVANGSRYESSSEAGVSHFIEHMLFKGTSSRSAAKIAEEMDRLGGQFNAYTSRENTTFYTRTLDVHLTDAMAVLSDMFMDSLFRDRDMALEKTVIYEEIDMYEDSPEDLVMDKLAEAAYDGALGRPIIGTRESLAPMTGRDLHAYMDAHYVPENTIVAVAGNYSDQTVLELMELFEKLPKAPMPVCPPAAYRQGENFTEKPIEQNHVAVAFPGITYTAPDRFEAQVFSNILGGGMSSRLFQKVREDAGLCYSIYSFLNTYSDTGMFGVYTALSQSTQARAEVLIREEIDRFLQNGPTQEELDRTRDQIKTNLLMGLESTMTRMNRLAQATLFLGGAKPLEETIVRYDAVTREGVLEIARKLCGCGKMSRAVVGKA